MMDNQFGLKTGYNTGFHYVGATPNETLNNINSWQRDTKQKYNDAKNQEIAANAQKMFECSVRTDDGQVSKMNLSGANLNNMALLIKQWSNENGYHSYDDMSDPGEVVCRYLNKNPHRFQITQDTLNNTISLDDWSSVTGVGQAKKGIQAQTQTSKQKEGPTTFIDFVANVGKGFLSFYETGGSAIRNAVDWTLGGLEGDQTFGAINNYAEMNGVDVRTPEGYAQAKEAISTPEGMDMYKPTIQRSILRGMEAGLDAAYTIFAPYVKGGFAVGENTPGISNLLGIAGTVMQGGGWLINHVTPLYFFRETLQTEEEKQEFDAFVGTVGFTKAFQKRGGRTNGNIKETMLKEIDPETTIKEFQKRITDAPSDIKEGWENMRYGKPTQENLEETAGKIAGAKTVEEQQTATRALQDSDIKGSKDYETLTDRLKKRGKEIEAEEDIEYSKDERKFKPEDTRSLKEFEKDGYKSAVMLKPVEDGIALLKDFYEGSPEKTAQLDLIEQKFHNEGLTKGEINNISRAISQEYETYKARGQQKTSIAAKDVEDIRRAVKNFAREGNDRLVELDKQWSDNMNTRAMVKDLQDAIVKFKTGKKSKNVFQKLAGVAADIFAYFGGKEFLGKILKNAVGENNYTPVIREADLKSLTNKFTKLNERINGSKNKAEAEKMVEDFNKEMEKEYGPIEGEVVDTKKEGYSDGNKYLEDKVEVE